MNALTKGGMPKAVLAEALDVRRSGVASPMSAVTNLSRDLARDVARDALDDLESAASERGGARRRRRKLWEIEGALLCSIIGTCLSREDTDWLLRRLKPSHLSGASDYEIHRYLVREAGRSDLGGRLMHKRLEANHSGIVKRFAREDDPNMLGALWEAAINEGKVAGAYWALLSHPAINDALKARSFGDVHMLSHISGGENRRLMRDASQMARRIAELEERLARNERQGAERARARDALVAELEAEVARLRALNPPTVAGTAGVSATDREASARLERRLENMGRRVATERHRARSAEAECERLRRALDVVMRDDAGRTDRAAPSLPPVAVPPADASGGEAADDLGGTHILYVGGRPHVLRHIRAAVEARNGCLLHHDGGMEQTTRCLEGLVERADIVVCPIDCVSHDACLRVKGMCKQRCKRFVPLRNAGASSFARALKALHDGTLMLNG